MCMLINSLSTAVISISHHQADTFQVTYLFWVQDTDFFVGPNILSCSGGRVEKRTEKERKLRQPCFNSHCAPKLYTPYPSWFLKAL